MGSAFWPLVVTLKMKSSFYLFHVFPFLSPPSSKRDTSKVRGGVNIGNKKISNSQKKQLKKLPFYNDILL